MKAWYGVWKAQQGWLLWNFSSKFSFSMTIPAELAYLSLNCDLESFIRAEMKTVESWAVIKPICFGWEELSRSGGSREVRPSAVASRALGAVVFIHNHSQACLWNCSSAELHLTWKHQRTEEYLVKETCHCKLLTQLVASWFRCLFSESNTGVWRQVYL